MRNDFIEPLNLDGVVQHIAKGIEKRGKKLLVEPPIEKIKAGDVVQFYIPGAKSDVAKDILKRTKAITPVGKSRNLIESFAFLLDKRSLVDEETKDEVLDEAKEVFVTNWAPYIGKIEAGQSFQAPSGIFEIMEMEYKRKFPQFFIEYNWRYIPKSKITDEYSTRDNRYPGIVIRDE